MPFIYFSQGVASQYQDFTERLMSHLALKGTEITGQVLKETTAQMHVKHTDEQGHLDIAVENENVKVSYTVDHEREEIGKGVMGRIDRADALYKEAQASFDKKEYATLKPKIIAAQNIVDKAREALSEAQNPK